MTHPSTAAGPRLNPFLFPSETTFRFILLLVALSGATLFIYHWLYFRLPATQAQLQRAIRECMEKLPVSTDCILPTFREQALFALAGLGLTIVVTVLIYWIYPRIVIRRHDLQPLSAADAPGLLEALNQLSREVGLQRAPTFLIDPRNEADAGIAFGRWGRYYVRLDAGLVLKFVTDRPIFDAVVRHELAHLRNADVSMTYLALIGWWVFLAGAMAVFAYDLIVWPTDTLTLFVWRFASILLLVYWARNAILRVRELYADAKAYQSEPGTSALARVIERGGEDHKWLGRLFGFHPPRPLRRAALDNPEHLFRISLPDAAAAGVAIGIGLPMVGFIVGQLYVAGLALWNPLLGLLVFVPFFVGGLGLGVWREIYASASMRRRSTGVGRLGIVAGLGFLVGAQLSPLPFLPSSEILPITLGHHVLTAAALLLFLFLLFRWIAAGAKAWVEAANSVVTLRRAYVSGLIIAALLAVSGCYWLLQFGGTLVGMADAYKVPILVLITHPRMVVGHLPGLQVTVFLICLWAFPLAADWWRLRYAGAARALPDATPAAALQPRARREIRIALTGALWCALVFLVLYVTLRLTVIPTLDSDDEAELFYFNMVLIVSFAQACLAAYVAWRSRRLSVFYGLCAAFVASCLMTIVFLTTNAFLLGRPPTADFVWQTFAMFANLGAIFSLPLALLASIRLGPARTDIGLPPPSLAEAS